MSHTRPARRIVRGTKRRARRLLVIMGVLPAPLPPAPAAPPPDPLRDREDELLPGLPGVVRHGERLAVVRDDLLSADAFLENFRAVAEVLHASGLPFAPMPDGRVRQRLAIGPGLRRDVLAGLAGAFADQAVYADLLGHDVTLATVLAGDLPDAVAGLEAEAHARTLAEAAAEAAAARRAAEAAGTPLPEPQPEPGSESGEPPVVVKGVRIYRPVVTSGRTLHYGADHGCDVEFWDPATTEGAVASIGETPYGWWVPSLEPTSSIRIGDRDYPTAAAFTQTLLEDVTFPVDAVITWVDDTDPVWQERRSAARAARLADSGGGGSAVDRVEGDDGERFHNRDELRYCLRSIAMYAPWIRRVFLVTDDQTPAWLETEHPGITVVSHRDIFADPTVLPVFNSHAIESQFHRIPGLSEHFLYFNDDVFLGRPLRAEDFFHGNGSPRLFQDTRIIPPGAADARDDEYVASQKGTRALLEQEHGRIFTKVLTHTPHPLRRSILAEVAERYADELAATTRSAFRSRNDIAPVTLASHVAYLTNRAVIGEIGHQYVDVDRYTGLEELGRLLAERSTETFCLNDGNLDGIPRDEQHRAVVGFLQDYYPVTGPFERAAPEPVARTGDEESPAAELPDLQPGHAA